MGHGFSECLPSRVNAGEDFVTLAEAEQKEFKDEVTRRRRTHGCYYTETSTQDAERQRSGFYFRTFEADNGYVLNAGERRVPVKE